MGGPVAELLAPVITAPGFSRQPAGSTPRIETLARVIARRRRRKGQRLA